MKTERSSKDGCERAGPEKSSDLRYGPLKGLLWSLHVCAFMASAIRFSLAGYSNSNRERIFLNLSLPAEHFYLTFEDRAQIMNIQIHCCFYELPLAVLCKDGLCKVFLLRLRIQSLGSTLGVTEMASYKAETYRFYRMYKLQLFDLFRSRKTRWGLEFWIATKTS